MELVEVPPIFLPNHGEILWRRGSCRHGRGAASGAAVDDDLVVQNDIENQIGVRVDDDPA